MNTADSTPNHILVSIMMGSSLSCLCINWIFSICPKPKEIIPQSYKWNNAATSFVHASIVGPLTVACLISDPSVLADLYDRNSARAEMVIALLLGYFVYDIIDHMRHTKLSDVWLIISHHVMALWGLGTFLFLARKAIYYLIIGSMSEMSSIFLHSRQFFQMCGIPPNNSYYKANAVINIIMAFVFRILSVSYMVGWLVVNYNDLPYFAIFIMTVVDGFLLPFNIVLVKRLLMRDIFNGEWFCDKKNKHLQE